MSLLKHEDCMIGIPHVKPSSQVVMIHETLSRLGTLQLAQRHDGQNLGQPLRVRRLLLCE